MEQKSQTKIHSGKAWPRARTIGTTANISFKEEGQHSENKKGIDFK